ncbi:TPA: hypothetical protein QCV77_005649 [Bacillus thuringiensis]|nr:hypothetical protein [Bacillus thuringiensis]
MDMREIEFQVFHKEANEMLCGHRSMHGISYYLNNPKYGVRQYTGITDKDGRRIYEGDILKTSIEEGNIITQVVFHQFCWQEKLISSPLNHLRDYFPFSGDLSIVAEVIGNIYESQGLLKN